MVSGVSVHTRDQFKHFCSENKFYGGGGGGGFLGKYQPQLGRQDPEKMVEVG